MNKKEKRKKRMKAQAAQRAHRRTRIETHGEDRIEVPAGPRPADSFHKDAPPKHVRRTDARGQAIAELAEIGIINPDDDLIREYQRTKRAQRGSKYLAQQTVAKAIAAMNAGIRRATETVEAIQKAEPGQQVVADEDGTRIEGKPNVANEIKIVADGAPSEKEWAELEAAAKKRRRGAKGYEKVLTDAGFVLRSGGNAKERTDWMRSS